jgi:hypothetical protein
MNGRRTIVIYDENVRRHQVGGRYWKQYINQQIEAWRTVKEETLRMLGSGEPLPPATIARLVTLCDRSIERLDEMKIYKDVP